ncbi:MAG: hypothetical protein GDA39_08475 [Hyphomonadaceae bacterium]|nr:hypothetical protein [Hyphomonadaceae bacterium]
MGFYGGRSYWLIKRLLYGRRRRSYWHKPERLYGQNDRDAKHPDRKYFVYVLNTDSGHYVGHSYSVDTRVTQHRGGKVQSTRGTCPVRRSVAYLS